MVRKNRDGLNGVPDVHLGSGQKPAKAARRSRRETPPARTTEPVIPAEPVPAEPNPAAIPLIRPDPPESIRVGAGGKLLVPRENLDDGLDEGTEIDLLSSQPKKIRRPDRREWIAVSPDSELTTRLLLHKPKADGVEVEHYYVHEDLRGPILDELKLARVFVFYSFKTRTHSLWIVNVTLENSWYESMQLLFKQPQDFFAKNAIRVSSDKANSRYRVRWKPLPCEVTWPLKETGELLGEALGADRFITSADHPVYRDLIEGKELS